MPTLLNNSPSPGSRAGLVDSDDLAVALIATVAWCVWLVLLGAAKLVVLLVRHPLLAVTAAGGWAVDHWLGRDVALGLVVALVVGLLLWRVVWPGSFHRRVAVPVCGSVRACVYRVVWPRVAARTGLVATSHHTGTRGVRAHRAGGWEREPARLRKVRTGHHADRLLLTLPAGLTPDDVSHAADALAHALRARQARVTVDRPGRVWLEMHRRDPLAATIPPLPVPAAALVDLGGVPVGVGEDGKPWLFRLAGTHVLVAGATGSGKGSVIWSLLHGLAPAVRDGWVAVWAVDPKGGMELRPGRALFARFEDGTPEAMGDLLEQLVVVKNARAASLADQGRRVHAPTPAAPHLLLVVDELATLTAFADRKTATRIDQALGVLLTQGRACGITVLACVQSPGKDVVGWRDLFPTRIALRLDNPIQVDMVLGDGAKDTGARPDQISELTPGVGYIRVEGTRAIRRVRAAYLTDHDIVSLAAGYPAPAHQRVVALMGGGATA